MTYRSRLGLAALLSALAALAAPAFAQVGHPAKGTWLGYWGPVGGVQHRMVLKLDWVERELRGTINPGPRATAITHANLDYDTWTLTVEAQMPGSPDGPARWVGTGKLENLGSWTNRRYSGTYQWGTESGNFQVILR